jgi:hypothetical protein
MIQLAPIQLTQGEAVNLLHNYRENGIGKDWTNYAGSWEIVQKDTRVCSGTSALESDGDIWTALTVDQINALSVPDQYRGRTLPSTYFQITITGAQTYQFRAAVTVIRGLNYGDISVDTASLTDDGGITLLAE